MDRTKCKVETVRIEANHVRVNYILFTETQEEVIVEYETYGQDRINRERAASIDRDDAIVARVDATDRTKETVEQSRLDAIETVMKR